MYCRNDEWDYQENECNCKDDKYNCKDNVSDCEDNEWDWKMKNIIFAKIIIQL